MATRNRLTDRTELATTPASNDLIHIVDVSDTTDNASGTSKKIQYSNLVSGGVTAPTSKTGTSIVFTEDALYNEATYLTSGNLTLSLTSAVKGTVVVVYCNGYEPTISGEDYFISSGSIDSSALNILSFFYDGTSIFLNIANVTSLSAPTLTLTSGDTEIQVDWSAITNVDNYVIERADDSGFTTNLTEIYNGSLLTYTNTGLTNGQTYYFRGKAQGNGFIDSAWSSTQSASPSVDIYSTMTVAYSLRKFEGWSNAVLKVRRSSDSATAFVFFDGATSSDLITLNSYISTSSDTTPSATTLTSWLGSDNLFVETWYGQTPDNTINTAYKVSRTITAEQSQIATAGVLDTTGGLPRLNFNGSSQGYFNGGAGISALNTGNQFTILTVSSNNASAGVGAIFCTSLTATSRVTVFNDRRTAKFSFNIHNGTTAYNALLNSQIDSANQRLVTAVAGTSNLMTAYYNGTAQTTTATYTGTYTNDEIKIGSNNGGGLPLNGTVQEVVIFPSDKTSDLTTLHSDINTYYSIY